ncbi:MAG: hypothetical protein VYC95_10330, partial [Verrucomicrobiota bacterium]|nr:hypothetical protein [Verrucomicrobiota bacterium]
GGGVGSAIAGGGRITSLVIPASGIKRLLAMEPAKPQLQSEDLGERKRNREFEPGDEDPFELMRRKMEEMRRLMEEIEEKDK